MSYSILSCVSLRFVALSFNIMHIGVVGLSARIRVSVRNRIHSRLPLLLSTSGHHFGLSGPAPIRSSSSSLLSSLFSLSLSCPPPSPAHIHSSLRTGFSLTPLLPLFIPPPACPYSVPGVYLDLGTRLKGYSGVLNGFFCFIWLFLPFLQRFFWTGPFSPGFSLRLFPLLFRLFSLRPLPWF